MGLYSTLFASTKEDTNDLVGALGLGSKSPFAYTDQFTVIARLDGEKRTYLAALGEDGTPGITLVSTVPTDEPQGLEISLIARNEDHADFEREAKSLAVGFDPAPDVDGHEIETVEPVYAGEDGTWAIFGNEVVPGSETLAVRQGCVIYPVDDYNVTRDVRNLMNWGHTLVIDVPVGDVSFTAGRETLSMDEMTRDNLAAHVERVRTAMEAEIEAKTSACKTRLDALELWFDSANIQDSLMKATRLQPRYNGEILHPWIRFGDDDPLIVRQGNSRKQQELTRMQFSYRDHVKFVVIRSDKKVLRQTLRYREVVEEHGKQYVWLVKDPTAKQLERLMRLSGISKEQVIPVASIPDPGSPKRGSSGKGYLQGVQEITSGYSRSQVEELPKDYYWVPVTRIDKSTNESVWRRARTAFDAGILTDKPVLTFSEGALKKYKPEENGGVGLGSAIEEVVEAGREAYTQAYIAKGVNANMTNAGLRTLVDPLDVPTHDHRLVDFGVMDWRMKDEADEKVAELTAVVRERYPLLFGSRYGSLEVDNADIEWYIEARDKELPTTLEQDLA